MCPDHLVQGARLYDTNKDVRWVGILLESGRRHLSVQVHFHKLLRPSGAVQIFLNAGVHHHLQKDGIARLIRPSSCVRRNVIISELPV